MVLAGTAWTAGLVTAVLCGWVWAVFPAALITAFLFKTVLRFNLKSIIFMLVSFCVAFGFYNAYDLFVYRKITSYSGSRISYSGTVTDMRQYSGGGSSLFLNGKINGERNAELMLYTQSEDFETGDRISFDAEVSMPENSFLFDAKDYYRSKGIYLKAVSAENITVNKEDFSLRRILYRFRERVCGFIDSTVPQKEGGMIKGMLFGDKSGMENDDRTLLYRTGIGHITAVSGLHLVLFSSLAAFVLRRLKTGKITEFAVTEILMGLFVLCCGMSPSVVRAFAVMTLVNAAPLFFRAADSFNSVCIAVILMTLSNPFIIENPSFLLSVSGALGAGSFAPYMTRRMRTDTPFRRFIKNAAYLLCISCAVTPVSVICFGEFSLISPLSNLIITPVCMAALLLSITGTLFIFVKPAFLFKLSGALCGAVMDISGIIGRNRFTHAETDGEFIAVITAVCVVFCIAAYLVFRNRKYSAASIVISYTLLFCFSGVYNIYTSQTVKIALLGNSETDVIVVSKGNRADIIDITGKNKNSRYAVKYLADRGIYDISGIYLTKCSYASTAEYDSQTGLFNVKNFTVPEEMYVRKGSLICGCVPKYSDYSQLAADYGSYCVSVKNKTVSVDYGGKHFEYGFTEKRYKTNSETEIDKNGKMKYRRLENGSS